MRTPSFVSRCELHFFQALHSHFLKRGEDTYMDSRKKNQKKPGVEQILLTVEEVGRLLRLSPSKVYTLLGDRYPGGIPVMRFGRSVRISLADLRWWIERYPSTRRQTGNGGKGDSQNEI
jgi:excisionase family DNA binding protein